MSVNIVDNKEVLKSSLWNFVVSIYQKTAYQLLACFCKTPVMLMSLCFFVLVFWWLTVNVLIPQYSALQKQDKSLAT